MSIFHSYFDRQRKLLLSDCNKGCFRELSTLSTGHLWLQEATGLEEARDQCQGRVGKRGNLLDGKQHLRQQLSHFVDC